jgi:hypothetical protein
MLPRHKANLRGSPAGFEASHCLARDRVSTLQILRVPLTGGPELHMKDKICLMFTALKSSGPVAR